MSIHIEKNNFDDDGHAYRYIISFRIFGQLFKVAFGNAIREFWGE